MVVTAAVLLATVHLPGRPRTFCLLRGATGIPCPFCGGTTSLVALGRGDVIGALRASPLLVTALAGWLVAPLHRVQRLPGRWHAAAVVTLLVCAELWQLGRFGYL